MPYLSLSISLAAVFTLGCIAIRAYGDSYPNEVRQAILAFFGFLVVFLTVGFMILDPPRQSANSPDRPTNSAASASGDTIMRPAPLHGG